MAHRYFLGEWQEGNEPLTASVVADLCRRAEAQRKHAIKLRRQSDLAYQNFVTPTGIILEDLDDAEWDNLLTRAKSEKAENDRKSREAWEHREKEREAAERLAEENRKLRAEQARKDAEAKEAREAAEREAASARAEADRLRKEREDAERAEAARREAEERAAQVAAQAPDAEKLRAFGQAIANVPLPDMATAAGDAALYAASRNLQNFLAWLEKKADALGGGGGNG